MRCLWLQPQDRNVTSNWYATDGNQVRAEDIIVAQHKGQECFDWEYYKLKNPDVAMLPQTTMWRHFLTRGAVEFREHRWKCALDLEKIMNEIPK
jgi:hypothetical protein